MLFSENHSGFMEDRRTDKISTLYTKKNYCKSKNTLCYKLLQQRNYKK